jgi:hypothetical protein
VWRSRPRARADGALLGGGAGQPSASGIRRPRRWPPRAGRSRRPPHADLEGFDDDWSAPRSFPPRLLRECRLEADGGGAGADPPRVHDYPAPPPAAAGTRGRLPPAPGRQRWRLAELPLCDGRTTAAAHCFNSSFLPPLLPLRWRPRGVLHSPALSLSLSGGQVLRERARGVGMRGPRARTVSFILPPDPVVFVVGREARDFAVGFAGHRCGG